MTVTRFWTRRARRTSRVAALGGLGVAWSLAGLAGTALAGQEPYEGNLPFFYDLYTFRGERGATEVVAAFAVPAGELKAEKAPGGVRYRFDVTLVLADTALRTVSRTDDSVFVALPGRLEGQHLLYTQVRVEAAPSPDTHQRVIMSEATRPGVGQLYHSPYPIPDYGGAELMLSDIALGHPAVVGEGWRRGDVTLALLPTTQFPSSAFQVYYEVYNLPEDHDYTTEISVAPLGGTHPAGPRATDPVGLRCTGKARSAKDGSVREMRRVEASLDRGAYRLTVTVTDDETGEAASRSRDFHVRGTGAGATLVAAHPWRVRTEP
jgi:hypothetical protein